jgi:hypothetical protein
VRREPSMPAPPDAEQLLTDRYPRSAAGYFRQVPLRCLPVLAVRWVAGWQIRRHAKGLGCYSANLQHIGLRNDERDDHGDDCECQGDPQHPADHARRAALPGFDCGLKGRRSVRHRRYSSAAMSASPLSASFRLCRCRGDSVSTTSSVGRTCAFRRWPPIAMQSAWLMTTCGCSAGLPSAQRRHRQGGRQP